MPYLKRFKDPAASYYARGRDSLPYLMLMLKSREADSREDAGGALSWLGKDDDGVVAELLAGLGSETEHQPRDSIVLTLGALKNRAAIPALAGLIRSKDTDGDTRRCAVESLGKIVRKRFRQAGRSRSSGDHLVGRPGRLTLTVRRVLGSFGHGQGGSWWCRSR